MTYNPDPRLLRGADCLQLYIREARPPKLILDARAPQIPPTGHKSHLNHLNIRSEPWRRLERICSIAEAAIDDYICRWVETHIPDVSLGIDDFDDETGERLTMPSHFTFDIPTPYQRPASDIYRFSPWLDNSVLITAQRVLHMLAPETHGWGFFPDTNKNPDDTIFQHFVWTHEGRGDIPDPDIDQQSVVFAFQPPWILSDQDLKEFSECQSFPPFRLPGHAYPATLTGKERLWAKMWDICARRNCPWFVLTSYNRWVFGAFSQGWTSAFVTTVFPAHDDISPSILECVIFWIASAMHLVGGLRVPEVPEPVNTTLPLSIPPDDHTEHNMSTPAPSESHWEGKSEEAPSSAGLDGRVSPIVSEAGLPYPPCLPRRKGSLRDPFLLNWLHSEIYTNGPAPDIPPSPDGLMGIDLDSSSSQSSTSSTPDTVDMGKTHKMVGDWLI